MPSASKEHMQALQELAHLRPYTDRRDFSKDGAMIKFFLELFNLKQEIIDIYLGVGDDYESITAELRKVHDTVRNISEDIRESTASIERLQIYLNNVAYLSNTGLRIEDLNNMHFMRFRLLIFSKENIKKLELNIENVPSAVFRVATLEGDVVTAVLTPESLEEEAERIFTSLNYKELELPPEYKGIAESVIKQIKSRIDDEKRRVEDLKCSILELREEYKDTVAKAYTLMELEKKAEKVKQDTALGDSMFFMFGFVPESEMESIRKEFIKNFNDRVILIADDVEGRRHGNMPPTRMKNNLLFKPFETLISMYGTPSYGEKDPTPFFAVSYMLLFGAMFGDLGQGLVIAIGGLLISFRSANKSFGGILTRLGASSMVFGALYGSIFGLEELLKPLLIRPMANINTMLIGAVALGVMLITVSYIYSLVNHFSFKDVEEGLFGLKLL